MLRALYSYAMLLLSIGLYLKWHIEYKLILQIITLHYTHGHHIKEIVFRTVYNIII